MSGPKQLDLQRFPSSAVGSYRSNSPEGRGEERTFWDTLKRSVVNNTLVAVGLRPTREESRHWDAVKGIVLGKLSTDSGQPADAQDASVVIQASHYPKDTPLVRHASGRDFSSVESTDGGALSPPPSVSLPARQMSVRSFKPQRATGRNQAIPLEPKPDLWKLAVSSISRLIEKREVDVGMKVQEGSFSFLEGEEEEEEEEEEDETDYGSPISLGTKFPPIMEVDEDQFFGVDHVSSQPVEGKGEGVEETDFGLRSLKPDSVRREKIKEFKKAVNKLTLSGGYGSDYGGLGGITKLLRFEYSSMESNKRRELDNTLLHKRPYFTYWLMFVHVVIMITALAVYGFAPYGWDFIERRELVRQTDLSFAVVPKSVVPSVWGGPPQQALVLLGALYAPCMRRDRQLFEGIEADRQMENTSSGCCVRRDESGCFQATLRSDCPEERFSDFVYEDVEGVRGVCGTSPKTCIDPSAGISSGNIWVQSDILTWPICRADDNANSLDRHLTCEITGRPCCFGVQAICRITTREHCSFLEGRFHQDAFLCSQVDCLNEICGLLPFARFNQPDQVYRLWIALFLHAGLIHLFLSLLFSFFVLRHVEKRLGWVRTAVIYIFSGIGGNLVSAYFAPYNPEVGPAGSILGVVAYFFVFLIFESPLLKRPWIESVKLLAISVALLLLGLIPYVDNYAHVGGFIFGFLISGVLVSYSDFKEVWKLAKKKKEDYKVYGIVKLLMVVLGLPAIVLLYALFFVLLYVVQSTVAGFSYLTCVPFTNTLCIDQQVLIRDRSTFIV